MTHGKTIISIFVACIAIVVMGLSPVASEPVRQEAEWVGIVGAAVPERVSSTSAVAVPTITATSAIVIDAATAAPLFELNPSQPLPPASTTKLMTALVARRAYDLDQVITITQEAFTQGTTMDLVVGEQIRVRELLAGLLISSGNDAAFALANNHPKGYSGFIDEMNSTAQELGMTVTHFNNPSGLDEENHKTTVRDLATVLREVTRDPVLKQIVGTRSDTVRDVTGEIMHELVTTHQLLGVTPGVSAGKTGTTPLAGEVLITQWDPARTEPQWRSIIIVTMNSQDRYADTLALLDWTKQNYYWRKWSELSTLSTETKETSNGNE